MIEQHIQELTAAIRELTAVCEKSLALSTEALKLTTENNALAREAITLSLHAASGIATAKAPAKKKKSELVVLHENGTNQVVVVETPVEAAAESPEREVSETDEQFIRRYVRWDAEWGKVTHIGTTPVAELESVAQAETPTAETPTAETPTAETPTAETPTAETPTAEPQVTVEDLITYVKTKATPEKKVEVYAKLNDLNKDFGIERVSLCPKDKCAEYLTAMKRWF